MATITMLANACCILWVTVVFVQASQKRGVGLNMKRYQCGDTEAFSGISWWYSWGAKDPRDIHAEMGCAGSLQWEIVPMVSDWWGQTLDFHESAEYVLGFNEPNHSDQSDMTPAHAASKWPKIEAAAGDRLLVSPVPARCGRVGGLCTYTHYDWLDQFFGNCTNCRIDKIALHTYTCNANNDMAFLEEAYNRYNKSVWLTEFACPKTDDLTKVENYMKDIVPRLEAAPFVERYAWFTGRVRPWKRYVRMVNSLLEQDSAALSPLGEVYDSL